MRVVPTDRPAGEAAPAAHHVDHLRDRLLELADVSEDSFLLVLSQALESTDHLLTAHASRRSSAGAA